MTKEEELNGLSYEIMKSLINNPDMQKKFQKYMDSTFRMEQEGRAEVLKEVEKIIKNCKCYCEMCAFEGFGRECDNRLINEEGLLEQLKSLQKEKKK